MQNLAGNRRGRIVVLLSAEQAIFRERLAVGLMEKSKPVDDTSLNRAALDQKVLDAIGRALKAHYDALVDAPLPKKTFDLLDQLEKEERREDPDASASLRG